MKKAFTMIELIFVIVIIGILAAVAIPKLSATRDDAKLSALMANTRICVNGLIGAYKGNGQVPDIDADPACVEARNSAGVSIAFAGDVIRVSGVHATLNGDYDYKGTQVAY